jgi:hypothetical protein
MASCAAAAAPVSLLGPCPCSAARTYPNYVCPSSVQTSHASSALALSGENIAIISPLPRRVFGVLDGNMFLQSKCAALAAGAAPTPPPAAAAAAAACTARCILTGLQPAIFLSLAMKQSQLLSQLQLPARALASFNTNSAIFPFRGRGRRDECCILLHGPSSRRPPLSRRLR